MKDALLFILNKANCIYTLGRAERKFEEIAPMLTPQQRDDISKALWHVRTEGSQEISKVCNDMIKSLPNV